MATKDNGQLVQGQLIALQAVVYRFVSFCFILRKHV